MIDVTEKAAYPGRSARHAIVLAVAALHALAIWQVSEHLSMTSRSRRPDSDATSVTIVLPKPNPVPQRKQPQATPAAVKFPIRMPSRLSATDTALQPAPIAIVPMLPAKNDDATPAVTPGISQQALEDVGKAVGDLRKEGLLPDISKPEHKPDRFEKAIASAARITETTTETFTGNDGHVVTHVSGPGGTYCVTTALDSDPDGMDRAQRGLALKKVHCPY